MDFEYQEEYVKNQRGVQLFTCRWLPLVPPKALVFLCHGYGMECSGFMRGCGVRLASAGFGVFGIDYEGHGKSQGARCYIKKFGNIVNDCDDFFKSICEEEAYRDKARFLYGESMGGAVALLLHRKDPFFWNGAVLVAPMCKVGESFLKAIASCGGMMGVGRFMGKSSSSSFITAMNLLLGKILEGYNLAILGKKKMKKKNRFLK